MKNKVRLAGVLVLICAFALVLAGCAGIGGKEKKENVYKIGILQLAERSSLDEATKGFKEGVISRLGEENVIFDEQDAQGENASCVTIASAFVSDKVDLIMANATPALQAASNATFDIPIVGTSVTDYASALDIQGWTGVSGRNVTGTSDLAPLDEQAQMIREIAPDAKQVGILYCAKELNSRYQIDEIGKHLDSLGIRYKTFNADEPEDVGSAAEKAAGECDVLYIPTDNVIASAADAVREVVLDKKIPVVAGEAGIAKVCGAVTLSISYYDIGFRAGEMAAEILRDKKYEGSMPVETAPQATKLYNKAICGKIGLKVPEGYEAIAEE